MYEKILAAIDESEAAERVLAAADELAKLSGGEIWLLHIWEGEPSVTRSVTSRSLAGAQSWLKTAVDKLAASGTTAHAVVVANLYAHAAREITNFAIENEIDVIVVGSRRHSGVAELLIGSTTHKVIHLADRPVVVVR